MKICSIYQTCNNFPPSLKFIWTTPRCEKKTKWGPFLSGESDFEVMFWCMCLSYLISIKNKVAKGENFRKMRSKMCRWKITSKFKNLNWIFKKFIHKIQRIPISIVYRWRHILGIFNFQFQFQCLNNCVKKF